jgi:tetratricopeptide (TPR) repeat protein
MVKKLFKANSRLVIPSLIFLIAITSRLGYTIFLKHHYFFYNHPASDVAYYQNWANEILYRNFFGDRIFWGLPLFPYVLAVIKGITFNNNTLIRTIFLLIGSGNCLLLYYLALAIFSRPVAVLAGFLCATNFIFIFYDWLMMPVTLLMTCTLLILLALVHQNKIAKPRDWFLFGLLVGLAILGDPKILIFLILLTLTWISKMRDASWPTIRKKLLLLTLGMFVILFSVSLRNRIVGGAWVFISTQSGLSFYIGNNENSSGLYENPEFIRPTHAGQDIDQQIIAEALTKQDLFPNEVSKFWRDKALDFIKNHPKKYFSILCRKSLAILQEDERAFDLDLILQRAWKYRWDLNPYVLMCPLALLGIILSCQFAKTNLLRLMILSQVIMVLTFFYSTRHFAPVLPLMILFESYTTIWMLKQYRNRRFVNILLVFGCCSVFILILPPRSLDSQTANFIYFAKSGPLYEKAGEYLRAEQEYLKALAIQPFDTNTLYNLGNTYLLQGNLQNAEDSYLRAISICPYNVDALFNLGYTYEQRGQLSQALKYYQKVYRFEAKDLAINYRLANIYQNLNDCSSAAKHIQFIFKNQPSLAATLSQVFSKCLDKSQK